MTTISAAKAKKYAGVYNASAVTYNLTTGAPEGVEAVQVDADGDVIRGCGCWSAWNGTKQYAKDWVRRHEICGHKVKILNDGCRAYLAALGLQVKE